jgi:hypothetical protein
VVTVGEEQSSAVTSACIRADIAAVGAGKELSVYRYSTNEELFQITMHDVLDHLVEVSPDGTQVAVSSRMDKKALIFDVRSQKLAKEFSFSSACERAFP